MYNSIVVIFHAPANSNTLLSLIIREFPFRHGSSAIGCGCPHFVFVWLLSFDVFEETCFVETGVITTWKADFVVVDAVWPGTVHTEFAGDREGFLNGYGGMFIWTFWICAIGEESAVFGFFPFGVVDNGTWMTHVTLLVGASTTIGTHFTAEHNGIGTTCRGGMCKDALRFGAF